MPAGSSSPGISLGNQTRTDTHGNRRSLFTHLAEEMCDGEAVLLHGSDEPHVVVSDEHAEVDIARVRNDVALPEPACGKRTR